jgi:hypothetical protein
MLYALKHRAPRSLPCVVTSYELPQRLIHEDRHRLVSSLILCKSLIHNMSCRLSICGRRNRSASWRLTRRGAISHMYCLSSALFVRSARGGCELCPRLWNLVHVPSWCVMGQPCLGGMLEMSGSLTTWQHKISAVLSTLQSSPQQFAHPGTGQIRSAMPGVVSGRSRGCVEGKDEAPPKWESFSCIGREGIEPSRSFAPADFKSAASAVSPPPHMRTADSM